MLGLEQSLGSLIVTYADDLVILCRRGKAEEALLQLREIMGKLRLASNKEKTRIYKVQEGESDFLGHTFVLMYSERTGIAYPGVPATAEEHQTHGREHPRADRPIDDLARYHRAGGQLEPHATRMGELLPSRHPHQSAPGDRQLHRCAVTPMVAPSTRSGDAKAGLIHSRTFTGTSSSYASAGLGTTCRG